MDGSYNTVPLPYSVQESLDQLCAITKQPQPDDTVRRRLALLSEKDALHLLGEIHRCRTPIRKLSGFINFMLSKRESSPAPPVAASSWSSPQSQVQSPFAAVSATTQWHSQGEIMPNRSHVLEQHVGYSGQPLYASASPSRVYPIPQPQGLQQYIDIDPSDAPVTPQSYLSSQGEAEKHGDYIVYSSDSPSKDSWTSYPSPQSPASPAISCARLYNTSQPQGETLNPYPGTVSNRQSPCSSSPSPSPNAVCSSPYEVLSSPNHQLQLCDKFQAQTLAPSLATRCSVQQPYSSVSPSKAVRSPYQFLSVPNDIFNPATPSSSQAVSATPYQIMSSPPVRLNKSFQGEIVAHSPVLDQPANDGQEHLKALGELEFRKQFLILSYAGGKKLKDVIFLEKFVKCIKTWKNLPMLLFEADVWEVLGQKWISKEDRRRTSDWDSGRTHLYHCHVAVDGSYKFKGPYLNKTRTLLQKELGDENVLMVKFAEEVTHRGLGIHFDNNYYTYSRVAREGILVGLRRYRFFVFKDGGNEEKKKDSASSPVKCYFVRVVSDAVVDRDIYYKLSNKSIREARCLFMHAHTRPSVANYMARFSLILSKTMTLEVDWSLVNVLTIDEVHCLDESGMPIHRDEKPCIHTDGTGFISEDLALLCPEVVHKGEISNKQIEGFTDPDDELEDNFLGRMPLSKTREPPLLIQFRLFYEGYAVKGTFLVNKELPCNTMCLRPSMIKVEQDPKLSDGQTINSLEIVGTSKIMKRTYLSRNLILLLCHGGVPKEFFMELLMKAFEEAHDAFYNIRTAFRVALRNGGIDDNDNVVKMISCGIPLEESYLQYRLAVLMKEEQKNLKKGRIYIPDSYYLMGTADPTGILERNEVCIILKDGPVSGKVLVYRNPGLHFGDIHVLKATYVKELESVVGNAKYSIFFSCKGPRSIADEMGGGDFDGDLYWISRNPRLLEMFKPSEPWIETSSSQKVASKNPSELTDDDLEDELFKLFLTTRFERSFAVSEAADNWLALMDQFLTLGDENGDEKSDLKTKKRDLKAKILRLIDIYYEALDAPKKGLKVAVPKDLKVSLFPHFMEKGEKMSYKSNSVLGSIYDTVNEFQTKESSQKEIEKLPIFDVNVPEDCLRTWEKRYVEYRVKMSSSLQGGDKEAKNMAADAVIREYKQILYGGVEEFEESGKQKQHIFNEALAIYHVCYNHARTVRVYDDAKKPRIGDVGKCGFAWKVAGAALCKLHENLSLKPGEKAFSILPSVLKEIM